ncbi:uncharacterized protein Hap1MRO34_002372 [Clarias gariepinus]
MASSKERRKRCRREGSTVDRDSPAKISKLLSSCPSQDGDDDFDGGSEDLCRPQRCQSIPLVPPSMSEVRIVLLGEDVLQTNRVGNFILGRSAFQIEVLSSVKLHCERASGQVEGKNITIINTPHLYNPQLSQEELNQREKLSSYLYNIPHASGLGHAWNDVPDTNELYPFPLLSLGGFHIKATTTSQSGRIKTDSTFETSDAEDERSKDLNI